MFGHGAPPGALAASFRNAIADHEQSLARAQAEVRTHGDPLAGRQASDRGVPAHDRYLGLVVQFEQRFEEMYLRWLRETLTFLESCEKENLTAEEPRSSTTRGEKRKQGTSSDK